jgi:uncharacterized protein with HEPN domain
MLRDIRMYLFDILNSIDSIFEYLGEKRSFKDYQSNKLLRRAVEREIEIIGEATNRLLRLDPTIDISDARRIVNLRNLVIHAYDSVDHVVIWGIVDKDLPLLRKQVSELLGNEII